MKKWPWITMLAAALLAASPFGRDLFYLAFVSGEQLSRNIAQPFLLMGIAILLALGAVEWWITRLLRKRRASHAAKEFMSG
jgi:membrane protein DedA with SNARE-associated domain